MSSPRASPRSGGGRRRRAASPRSGRSSPRSPKGFNSGMTEAQKVRQKLGAAQNEEVKVSRALQKALDLGPQTRHEFLAHLKRKFGTIPRAWRLALDPQKNGKLNRMHFCNAARNLGFCDNLNALWKDLDYDGTGFITLDEMDKEAAEITWGFKDALVRYYGSVVEAWVAIDSDKTGRVEEREIMEVCERIGYHGWGKKLFEWYDYDHSGYITLDEIDHQAAAQLQRQDLKYGLVSAAEDAGPFGMNRSTQRRLALSKMRAERAFRLQKAKDGFARGVCSATDFHMLVGHAIIRTTPGGATPRLEKFARRTQSEHDLKNRTLGFDYEYEFRGFNAHR